jgi:protein phosphatase
MVRSENQDGFLVYDPPADALGGAAAALAVVADGMGGAAGGRTASRLAIDAFASAMLGRPKTPPTMTEAIQQANAKVYQRALADSALRGMGTTMTAVRIEAGRLHFGHVGDSRLLLLRDGKIGLKTKDHVKVGSSELTRALGIFEETEVDVGEFELQEGDCLLLCSDGLWDLVKPPETREVLQTLPPDAAARRLVAMANKAEGHDNITAIVIRIGTTDPATEADSVVTLPTLPAVRRITVWLWIGLAALAVALVVLAIRG